MSIIYMEKKKNLKSFGKLLLARAWWVNSYDNCFFELSHFSWNFVWILMQCGLGCVRKKVGSVVAHCKVTMFTMMNFIWYFASCLAFLRSEEFLANMWDHFDYQRLSLEANFVREKCVTTFQNKIYIFYLSNSRYSYYHNSKRNCLSWYEVIFLWVRQQSITGYFGLVWSSYTPSSHAEPFRKMRKVLS